VHEVLSADPTAVLRHGYTYSGHASACAAAMVCLDITEREGLLDRAKVVGARLSSGLQGLLEDGLVSGVRGEGAVWAVETLAGVDAVAVRDATMANGVIVRPVGATTLAMCPPLVSTDGDVDEILSALRAGLEQRQ